MISIFAIYSFEFIKLWKSIAEFNVGEMVGKRFFPFTSVFYVKKQQIFEAFINTSSNDFWHHNLAEMDKSPLHPTTHVSKTAKRNVYEYLREFQGYISLKTL